MGKSKIEWTDETWNPVTGCTKVSLGCKHCYAERMARRLAGRCGYPEAPYHFNVTLHHDRLEQPLRWKKPRRIFVCSMGDLFHENVPSSFIFRVWQKMFLSGRHTFQILTKRPGRMLKFIQSLEVHPGPHYIGLPNIWLGVSVENQAAADERREHLRQIPAAVKFVSYEPALGPVDWTGWEFVNQIISGGESGPRARPSHPNWHRATRDFCQENDISYFFKQWGEWVARDLYDGKRTNNEAWGCLDAQGLWYPETTTWNGRQFHAEDDYECTMLRVGKKAAGCLLDGILHKEYP